MIQTNHKKWWVFALVLVAVIVAIIFAKNQFLPSFSGLVDGQKSNDYYKLPTGNTFPVARDYNGNSISAKTNAVVPAVSTAVDQYATTTTTSGSILSTTTVATQSNTTSTTHQFGIMTVTYGGNATINKAVVAAIDQTSSSSVATPQVSTNFAKNTQYAMYFSGVSGFTENHPYGAPAGFVDSKASITLYDQNNNVVFSEPDVFSSYVGGVPAADFAYLTFKLTLDKNFKSGNYRWESVVTDNKDSSNYLKGVVNFTVN